MNLWGFKLVKKNYTTKQKQWGWITAMKFADMDFRRSIPAGTKVDLYKNDKGEYKMFKFGKVTDFGFTIFDKNQDAHIADVIIHDWLSETLYGFLE